MKMIRFDGPAMHRCNSLGNPVSYGAAPVKRNTGQVYWFDNVMYANLATPWTPTTERFDITLRMRPTALDNRSAYYVTGAGQNCGLGLTPVNAIRGVFNDGTQRFLLTPVTAAIDTSYDLVLHCEAGNNYAEALLQKSGINTGTAVPESNAIRNIGGGAAATAITGYMGNLRLIDVADPSNSVFFPMDEGAGNTLYAYDSTGTVNKPEFNATIINFNEANWITYLLPAQQPVLP